MPVSLGAIQAELLPGLFDVRGRYEQIPRVWSSVFQTRNSNMSVETSTQMRFLGLPQLKAEGAPTQFDNNSGQRFKWNFVHNQVSLGYAFTREAIDDSLYKTQFDPTNLNLMESFAQFKEILCANVLNTCTTANAQLGGDGVALSSASHPYDGGTWANTPSVQQDLNETSLLSAMVAVRTNFVDEAGLKVFARARRLLVPPQQEPMAIRLTKTELRPGTANNDVNAILMTAGGLPEGYLTWDFLSSQNAWFLTTNLPGLIMMQRIPYEMDMWVDNITDNLLVKGYERYVPNYNDPRAVFCNTPSS